MEYTLDSDAIDRIAMYLAARIRWVRRDPIKYEEFVKQVSITDLIKREARAKEELNDILDRVKGARIEQQYNEREGL